MPTTPMASRRAFGANGSPSTTAEPPPLRRRLSMDEDLFYHQIVTAPRRPSQPPPYQEEPRPRRPSTAMGLAAAVEEGSEKLPDYSCSVNCEGIFSKKLEIENTTKRAEDRRWHSVFVSLNGTALNIHDIKKDWGWGKSRDGPNISPDNPPWLRKGKLEKSYSLQYADVGIALDYQKRRHVIRVRAEADQFLLSCIELSSFLKWLDVLFAAIDVAAPIDERDFPRDQSIPRIQRIRWFRGQSPARRPSIPMPSPRSPDLQLFEPSGSGQSGPSRRPSQTQTPSGVVPFGDGNDGDSDNEDEEAEPDYARRERERDRDPISRLSTTSYPNEGIDYLSGKWAPEHNWSSAHDMLYAKLCYSALLFKSPRKSNYIINKGKKWFVDWTTGRTVRVLPPEYGDLELFGPWQVIHTENRRI